MFLRECVHVWSHFSFLKVCCCFVARVHLRLHKPLRSFPGSKHINGIKFAFEVYFVQSTVPSCLHPTNPPIPNVIIAMIFCSPQAKKKLKLGENAIYASIPTYRKATSWTQNCMLFYQFVWCINMWTGPKRASQSIWQLQHFICHFCWAVSHFAPIQASLHHSFNKSWSWLSDAGSVQVEVWLHYKFFDCHRKTLWWYHWLNEKVLLHFVHSLSHTSAAMFQMRQWSGSLHTWSTCHHHPKSL